MGDLMEHNKTYYGYKPKSDNLSKLTRYLLSKTQNKTLKPTNLTKLTNSVLKNKRF
jgi:hypothetical protein